MPSSARTSPEARYPSPLTALAPAAFGGADTVPPAPVGGSHHARTSALVVVALLAAGLLLATAASENRRSAPAESRERAALATQVAGQQREVDGLAAALIRLQHQIEADQAAARTATARGRAAAATVRRLAPVTGAAAVTGPGLVVRLDDPPGRAGGTHRITDTDVQQVVNALWAAGAEAVAVDGARITARTAIRTAGDAILVDFRPLAPPYAVSAIGPPDTLGARFADSAVAARLRTAESVFGSGFDVRLADHLRLPAAADARVSAAKAGRP